ncbi:MAG: hypothetical protein C4551_10055 [Bacillota bacterium]|jgi:hypothetical protein|nr:MAG: hypothetical protein C4551_10055 [Bacillota bacterium]
MAYSNHLYIAGETVTAVTLNGSTYYNWAESFVGKVTTAGDICYATGANALARLGIGTAGQWPVVNAGANALEHKGFLTAVASATATWNGTNQNNWVSDVLTVSITPGGAYGLLLIMAAAEILSDDLTYIRVGVGADNGPEVRRSGSAISSLFAQHVIAVASATEHVCGLDVHTAELNGNGAVGYRWIRALWLP